MHRLFLLLGFILCMFYSSYAEVPTIAVSYFDNTSGDTKLEPLKKGLADMLISDLASIKAVRIVEREKLEKLLEEIQLGRSRFVNPSSAQKLGEGLGAEYLLTGSYLILNDSVRIDARVIRVETSEIVMGEKVSGTKREFFKMEKELVRLLLSALEVSLDSTKNGSLLQNRTESFEAFEMYTNGLDQFDKNNVDEASHYLQRAVVLDPRYKDANELLEKISKFLKGIRDKDFRDEVRKFVLLKKLLEGEVYDSNLFKSRRESIERTLDTVGVIGAKLEVLRGKKVFVKKKKNPYTLVSPVVVSKLVDGGAFDDAGIRTGDILLAINERKIYANIIDKHMLAVRPGNKMISVLRRGEIKKFDVYIRHGLCNYYRIYASDEFYCYDTDIKTFNLDSLALYSLYFPLCHCPENRHYFTVYDSLVQNGELAMANAYRWDVGYTGNIAKCILNNEEYTYSASGGGFSSIIGYIGDPGLIDWIAWMGYFDMALDIVQTFRLAPSLDKDEVLASWDPRAARWYSRKQCIQDYYRRQASLDYSEALLCSIRLNFARAAKILMKSIEQHQIVLKGTDDLWTMKDLLSLFEETMHDDDLLTKAKKEYDDLCIKMRSAKSIASSLK